MSHPCILRVAINTPLRRLFDYLPPRGSENYRFIPGQRLLVPFGKNRPRVGVLIAITDISTFPAHKLKHVLQLLDNEPLFDQEHLEFLLWAAHYYHHPPGEVILGCLPKLLRNGSRAIRKSVTGWRLTPTGRTIDPQILESAPRQKALFMKLLGSPSGTLAGAVMKGTGDWHGAARALARKGLIERFSQAHVECPQHVVQINRDIVLNHDQKHAVVSILSTRDRYQPILLNGITGSGKTEVYIQSIERILGYGRQALVLLPEIGLTPQFIGRFKQRLPHKISVLHSALTDNERLQAWLTARDGETDIVIGTRSALWTPFKNLGIIIIDEEHDPSYKQQDNFRYSARDMAIIRARRENIPVVLGSATPSLESMVNAVKGRYQEICLQQRAGNASLPQMKIIDLRTSKMDGAVSFLLLDAIRECLDKKEQVLLFLNRRGYAPVLMCHNCGWICKCPRCDIQMTFHKHKNMLCCHYCGHVESRKYHCPECHGDNIAEIGHGTQRLTETLTRQFPGAGILRIDRDSTRRKGAMQNMLADIHQGKVNILIGTQMLAKGHHFPDVTLVGIIDADRGLYSADYRASERMGQIIMQVSGRAGRAEKPGTVMIQSHHPDHPLLQTLARHDYTGFTSMLARERKETMLPPFSHHVLLRAEAANMAMPEKFLREARASLPVADNNIEIFGPLPSPMERRAGHYRMQLLLQAKNRTRLRTVLDGWVTDLETLPDAHKVRWSIDVDPQDLL